MIRLLCMSGRSNRFCKDKAGGLADGVEASGMFKHQLGSAALNVLLFVPLRLPASFCFPSFPSLVEGCV
jgi:hypothetical protein